MDDADQAVRALGRLPEIDRRACRRRVKTCFSIDTMVAAYERVHATIFALEEAKNMEEHHQDHE